MRLFCMKKYPVTFLQIGILSGTRAVAAAGLALLLTDRIPKDSRKVLGWSLFGTGTLFFLGLMADLFLKNHDREE